MSYIGQRPVVGRYIKLDQISSGFNGSETSFSMTAGSQAVFPGTARNLLLSLGGVIQEPDTSFTISGSTLTFTTAPVANTTFFAVIFGDMQSTGTPSDGTVLPASIASSGNFSFPQLTVTGTSSLGDDVTFTGANYNVVWDKSDNALEFADSAKAVFGDGADLQIYHDGSNSYINDLGTGNLLLVTNGTELQLLGAGGGDFMVKAVSNGAVELYHDNSKKFETTSTGVSIPSDTTFLQIGAGQDLDLHHNGTNYYIRNQTGDLHIRPLVAEEGIILKPNGAVEQYFDNTKKFETTTNGVEVTGDLRFDSSVSGGTIRLGDDQKLFLGGGNDLQIYHDGTNSLLTNATNDLRIRSNSLKLQSITGEEYLTGTADGSVSIFHNNVVKLTTNIDGYRSNDNVKAQFGDSSDLQIYHDGSHSNINNSTGNLRLQCDALRVNSQDNNESIIRADKNGAVELYYDNGKKFDTNNLGVRTHGTHFLDGDVHFANSGFTDGILWDKSASTMRWKDNNKALFGDGSDLEIYHDGTNSIIQNNTGVFYLKTLNGEFTLVGRPAGATELYYDHSKKFETTTSGGQVNGSLTLTSHLVLGNNDEIKLGSASQMTIWHSGSDFNMYNNTGNLIISNASGTGVGEGALVFKSGNNNTRWTITSGGDFVPASNNAFAIGSSSNRVSIIYSNAALNTSDKTLKNTITTSDLGLDFINKLKPVSYKWNQYEGEISDTRTHYGLIAQDVEEVITSSGKTLNDFGGVDKPDEGCMGLAYSQFISPLIKAVQELSAKVETLETKVAAIEAA